MALESWVTVYCCEVVLTTMMLLSFFFKVSLTRRVYWFLGIAAFLLITAIIGTHTPNDLRFRARPSLNIPQESIHWKTRQSTGLQFESKETETQSLPPTGMRWNRWNVTETQSLPPTGMRWNRWNVTETQSLPPTGMRWNRWNVTETLSSPPTVSNPDWSVSLPDTAFGIYIFLDNASLESGNAEDQWDSLNHSISSSCRSVHRLYVRFLIDKNDSQRTDVMQFIDRYFNTSSILCEEFGTRTEFRTVEVGDLRKGARTLTQLMTSDYVTERISYFSVIFVPDTEYRGFPDQLQLLLDKSSDGVGLLVDYARNSRLPSSLFFSKIHDEIFGWFLPPFLADVQLALTYTFHVYPTNLTFTLRNQSVNSSVEGIKDPKSAGFSPAGLWALELDKDTLRRYLSVSRATACFRCVSNSSRKIISMSLYGEKSRYTMGVIRNAQLLPITFPGWRLWIYVELPLPGQPYEHGQVPPTILAKLVELGAEIRYVDVNVTGLAPMMWRFTVTEDPDVDVFIVRDCDSRLTHRDAVVVSDWLRTGKVFHCIRDHPSHSRFPVSGGLWGARRNPFRTLFGEGRLRDTMRRYGSAYVQDMKFLDKEVWPMVTHVAYCHDSFSCRRYPASHPFPVARVGAEHLGQVYDEFSTGRKSDMAIILRTPVNTKCAVSPKKNSVLP